MRRPIFWRINELNESDWPGLQEWEFLQWEWHQRQRLSRWKFSCPMKDRKKEDSLPFLPLEALKFVTWARNQGPLFMKWNQVTIAINEEMKEKGEKKKKKRRKYTRNFKVVIKERHSFWDVLIERGLLENYCNINAQLLCNAPKKKREKNKKKKERKSRYYRSKQRHFILFIDANNHLVHSYWQSSDLFAAAPPVTPMTMECLIRPVESYHCARPAWLFSTTPPETDIKF